MGIILGIPTFVRLYNNGCILEGNRMCVANGNILRSMLTNGRYMLGSKSAAINLVIAFGATRFSTWQIISA